MRIVLEKFLVVIRFDDERVHLAQTLDQHLRGTAEIGDITRGRSPGVKRVADWLDCVMRHGESLHRDIADGEFRAGAEQTPVAMTRRASPQRIASAVSELQ